MPERRKLMQVRISFEFLEDMLRFKSDRPIVSNLPEGVRLVNVLEDRYVPRCARFIFEHESFKPTAELCDPPDFDIECYEK